MISLDTKGPSVFAIRSIKITATWSGCYDNKSYDPIRFLLSEVWTEKILKYSMGKTDFLYRDTDDQSVFPCKFKEYSGF